MRLFRSLVFAVFALAAPLASTASAGSGGGGANGNGGNGNGNGNGNGGKGASGGVSSTEGDGGFVPQSGDSSTGGRAILDPRGSRACICEWSAAPNPAGAAIASMFALALAARRRRR